MMPANSDPSARAFCNRLRDDLRQVGKVGFVRGPQEVGKAVVHDDGADARHQHAEQSAIGLERGVRRRLLGRVYLDLRRDSHPSFSWVRSCTRFNLLQTGQFFVDERRSSVRGRSGRPCIAPVLVLAVRERYCDAVPLRPRRRRAIAPKTKRPPGIRIRRNTPLPEPLRTAIEACQRQAVIQPRRRCMDERALGLEMPGAARARDGDHDAFATPFEFQGG